MARVAVEFYASGNFAPLLAQLNAANAALRAQAVEINALGKGINSYALNFKNAANAIGGFNVSSHTVLNNTSKITEQLRKEEVAWKDLGKVRQAAGAIAQQQARLSEAAAVSLGSTFDKVSGQLIVPDKALKNIDLATSKAQIMNRAYASAFADMEKRGKNMQWAGRQLTVGLTVPILALAAASGKMAYDVDQGLTRVIKVYGDTGTTAQSVLNQVKKDTLETAKVVAREFGIAGKETIDLAADFAAAGLQGQDLQKATRETSRIIMLGELDKQKAFQTTIAIQSVFKQSTQELGNTFNFLNAVENQTSTTLQDLTESIPRVGGVIKSLGGTVKDAAIFTVAFKQNGISAAQGANALRSSLGAILAPSKAANKTLESMGINLENIQKTASQSSSPIISMLQQLGAELDKMGGAEKQKALSTLFGRYQFNKMGQLIQALTHDTNNLATQTGRAFALTHASIEDLAQIADSEAKQMQQSISGKIKREWESLKLSLVDTGRKALPAVLAVIKAINNIVSAFKALPGPVKSLAIMSLAVIAIVGPLKMLLGLMVNLGSQFGKFATRIGEVIVGKAKLITAEEAFVNISKDQVIPELISQEVAWEKLNARIAEHTDLILRESMRAAGRTPAQINRDMNPAMNGSMMWRAQQNTTVPLGVNAAEEERLATAANKANFALKARISILATSALMFTSLTGAGGRLSKVLDGLLIIFMLFPGIVMKVASAIKTLAGAGAIETLIVNLRVLKVQLGEVIAEVYAAVGPWVILGAAIAAALGGVFYLLHRNNEKVNADAEKVRNGAKSMAQVVGAAWNETSKAVGKNTNALEKNLSLADQLSKKNSALVKTIRDIQLAQGDAAAQHRAEDFGIEMMQHGAKAEEAQKMVQALLTAAGGSTLAIGTPGHGQGLDFSNAGEVASRESAKIGEDAGRIMSNHFSQSAWEGFKRFARIGPFGGSSRADLNDNAYKAAEDWAGQFVSGIEEGMGNPQNRQAMTKALEDAQNALDQARANAGGDKNKLHRADELEGATVLVWKEKLHLQGEEIDKIKTIAKMQDYLAAHSLPVNEAVQRYNELIGQYNRNGVKVTDAIKQQAAANVLYSHSFSGVTSEMIINTAEGKLMVSTIDNLKNATDAYLADLNDPNIGGAFLQDLKSNLQDATSSVIDEGMRLFDKQTAAGERALDRQNQAADDSIQKQEDKQNKFFENKRKAIERSTQKAIDAIRKEDAARDAAFKAQMDRLKKEADAANTSIDINAALKSGNTDEAARLAGNAYYQSQQDDMQAANDAAKAQSDLRVKALEDEKQKQLDILDIQKATAKKQLDATKKLEQDKQRVRREAYEQSRAYERSSLLKSLQLYKDAATTNQDQFTTNLNKIYGMFSDNGITLGRKNQVFADAFSNGWKDSLERARQEVAADKGWTQLGQSIANAAAQGAVGMNFDQFIKYLEMTPAQAKKYREQIYAQNKAASGPGTVAQSGSSHQFGAVHGGGFIDGALQPNRLGRSMRDPKIYPDEVGAILQKGEYVVNKDAVDRVGIERLDALNSGAGGADSSGRMHSGGLAGVGVSTMGMLRVALNGLFAKAIAQRGGVPGGATGPAVANSPLPADASLLDRVVYAIKMQESGGNYTSHTNNPKQTASGAYQYIDRTWNNYKGYPRAYMAPPSIQDARATADTSRRWGNYHDWQKVIAGHFYPAWAGDKSKWYQVPKPGNPTVWNYVAGVERKGGLLGTPGFAIPQLRTGGMVLNDNTLANLHKAETVLTAPLSAKLERGIDKLDSRPSIVYDVDVIVPDTNASPERIAQVVMQKLEHAEMARGASRRIKSK